MCKRICRRRLKRLKASFAVLTYVRLREKRRSEDRVSSSMTFPNFPDESLSEINLNCVTCPCLTPCCCLYSGQQHRETSLPKLPHFKGKLWKNKLFTEGYQGRERFLLFVVFIGENRPTLPSRLYHWLESDEDSRGAAARKAASRETRLTGVERISFTTDNRWPDR